MTKTIALFIAVFAIAPMAHAAVLINSITVDPNPATPGQSIDVHIEVERTGSGCTNNWGATDILVDGATTTFSYGPLDYTQGTGTSSATHSITAPNATADIDVLVYRGNEVNPNNCDTSIVEDTATETLTINVPAPPPSAPASSGSHVSGGGGYMKCAFWNGWNVGPEHRCLADNGEYVRTMDYRTGNVGGVSDATLVALYTQVIQKLTHILTLL